MGRTTFALALAFCIGTAPLTACVAGIGGDFDEPTVQGDFSSSDCANPDRKEVTAPEYFAVCCESADTVCMAYVCEEGLALYLGVGAPWQHECAGGCRNDGYVHFAHSPQEATATLCAANPDASGTGGTYFCGDDERIYPSPDNALTEDVADCLADATCVPGTQASAALISAAVDSLCDQGTEPMSTLCEQRQAACASSGGDQDCDGVCADADCDDTDADRAADCGGGGDANDCQDADGYCCEADDDYGVHPGAISIDNSVPCSGGEGDTDWAHTTYSRGGEYMCIQGRQMACRQDISASCMDEYCWQDVGSSCGC